MPRASGLASRFCSSRAAPALHRPAASFGVSFSRPAPVTSPTVTPISVPATTNVAIQAAGGESSGSNAGSRNVHGNPANQPSTLATIHEPGFATTSLRTLACAEPGHSRESRSRSAQARRAPRGRRASAQACPRSMQPRRQWRWREPNGGDSAAADARRAPVAGTVRAPRPLRARR